MLLRQVGKPVEEVKRYGEALWRVGPKTFTPDGWRRIRTRVEMREKKLAEVIESQRNGGVASGVPTAVCRLY